MVVESAAAAFHADGLGCGNLHVIDKLPVHQRLEDRVAEAKGQEVLHGLFAQIVVDAIDLVLAEPLEDIGIQGLGRVRSWPNGFSMTTRRQAPPLDSVTRPACDRRIDDRSEEFGIGRQVKKAIARQVAFLLQRLDVAREVRPGRPALVKSAR